MTHRTRSSFTAMILGVAALTVAVPVPAAGQGTVPITAAWEALPGIVPEGATVVVRTLDGGSARGRLQSLSETAIVLEGGRVRTIPALEVVSVEGARGPRPYRRGARIGIEVGLLFAGLYSAAAADTDCLPEECVSWNDALAGAFILPAIGAGIGAGIGALIPGKRRLIYSAGTPGALAVAPITGKGRRGAAVRIAF